MTGSNRTIAVAFALACHMSAGLVLAEEPVLRLRANVAGAASSETPLTIELLRWSTDAERAPLLAALAAPPPPPGGGAPAAGRGGRGGRGAAPPPSPMARLTGAVKAAPTVGYIWSDGVTGYSIKYAWRAATADGAERIVLVTDRRLGAHWPSWPQASGAAADAEFTLIEMRVGASGSGEARTSLTTNVVVDGAAKTLALDGSATDPALLEVTR